MIPVGTGKRTKLVTFKSRAINTRTNTRDIATYTWSTIGTRWVQVQNAGGAEREFAGQRGAQVAVTIRFPYVSTLTAEDKVVMDSTDYGIDRLENVDGLGIEQIALLKQWTD